jgi:hypothetical protein
MSAVTGAHFAAEIDAYLAVTGMTATAFGLHAMGSSGFLIVMRRTKSPRPSTIEKARSFMHDYPCGLAAQRQRLLRLPSGVYAGLGKHAASREISVTQLAARLLAAIVADDMVAAVLDDGTGA